MKKWTLGRLDVSKYRIKTSKSLNILLAPDKFKGSLSAAEVAAALAKGLVQSCPCVHFRLHPLADGGDGSLAVLQAARAVEIHSLESVDPLGRPLLTTYLSDSDAAYIELASAAGLVLLRPSERNPLLTSTRGTGLQIRDALARGKRHIYLFLGGSATHDGGMGVADVLGFRFVDASGHLLAAKGENLEKIVRMDFDDCHPALRDTHFYLVCDVTNPLIGPVGAAAVYAAQKGADAADIRRLEQGLRQLADVLVAHGYPAVHNLAGAGAAGGVGGGLHALLGARLQPGFSTMAQITNLADALAWADLVISGEGHLDTQTAQGKVVAGVQAMAAEKGKPLAVVCGAADKEAAAAMGLDTLYTILDRAHSLEDAMENAAHYLAEIGAALGAKWC